MNEQFHNTDSLDFDFWKQLAEDDPEAFETLRREKVEQLIARAPAAQRRRLQGLQWQIDQTRKLAGSPMASCLAISNMMWDSLHQLNRRQHELLSATPETLRQPQDMAPAATVLAFPAQLP
ncbi:MAG TPA: DUF3135 domain-containing protein [Gammaproteobacteria bacterium]|nr:DUF3135 domain-containing protein [Gammaproteobacteria bacterium]